MPNPNRRTFLAAAVAAPLGATALAQSTRPTSAKDLGLFSGINRVEDPANMTASEKKHAPVIRISGPVRAGEPFEVTVDVGTVPHPMTDDHWIESIRLFTDDGDPIAHVIFGRTGIRPSLTVWAVAREGLELVAQSTCNLHGIWESRRVVPIG